MNLSQKAIIDLQNIYNEEFHESINEDEAKQIGSDLIQLFKLLNKKQPNANAPP